jgi:glutamate-5-semialdehyde dehydrogenase
MGMKRSMAAVTVQNLEEYCLTTARGAKEAATQLASLPTRTKNDWLKQSAVAILANASRILEANAADVADAPAYGLSDAAVDRLRLDTNRLQQIAQGLEEVAVLPDPVGEVIEGRRLANGLDLRKVRVPLGTVFFIYESRPNVTVDAAAICVKSGNAVILRGGKEAFHSSTALIDVLHQTARRCGIPPSAVQLVQTLDRQAVGHLLALPQWIDVAIPRGGKSLIERVVREAKMPVIKHFDGNCHVYIDATANHEMAKAIVINAKCQRMGVCNACESLLVHRSLATTLLPEIVQELQQHGVEVRGDASTRAACSNVIEAVESDWFEEYLGPIISVRVVDDLDQAITHINQYGSHHTDAIVTQSLDAAQTFQLRVDSSAVIVNASTRFNDGGELGLGAEIGISTDKFHARGPCGLRELTSYKYLITGNGNLRT